MQQKGYSAYRLAKIIGASNQGVLLWQTGKNTPHPKTRQKIADHFGITLAELDGDELPVLPENGAKKAPATDGEGEKDALIKAVREITDKDTALAVFDELSKKMRELM
jgi:transcriptional regulator with XRE-family HTH domain